MSMFTAQDLGEGRGAGEPGQRGRRGGARAVLAAVAGVAALALGLSGGTPTTDTARAATAKPCDGMHMQASTSWDVHVSNVDVTLCLDIKDGRVQAGAQTWIRSAFCCVKYHWIKMVVTEQGVTGHCDYVIASGGDMNDTCKLAERRAILGTRATARAQLCFDAKDDGDGSKCSRVMVVSGIVV